ncbi:MAG: DUF1952 domain-containing protein [Anaerolineae bacterium]
MIHIDRIIRSIPAWLMETYLQEVGGEKGEDGRISGPGWSAHVEQIEDFKIYALSIGQIRLQIDVEDDIWPDLSNRIETKLLRGGG